MRFDHAIVGGGVAGSSLAWRLAPLGKVLMIDPVEEDRRTFATWGPDPFGVGRRSWPALRAGERPLDLRAHRYWTFEAGDLRRIAEARVRETGGVVVRARADEVWSDGTVRVDGERHEATWVYDSRHPPIAGAGDLIQSFLGWWVTVDRDTFDAGAATLMDFGTPQGAGLRFFYVLPDSPRRALVMGVTLGVDPDPPQVAGYLRERLGLMSWEVEREEAGATTLTLRRFDRRDGQVLRIGLAGGLLKPSTGYAFTRIQHDSDQIVASLGRHGHPFDVRRSGWIWRLLDAWMLRAIRHQGAAVIPVFAALFARNPMDRVLRFLEEESGFWETSGILATLPPTVFIEEGLRLFDPRYKGLPGG